MRRLRILAISALAVGLAAPLQALDWEQITLNGYVSFELERQLSSDGYGDPNGSFDADLFDLVFNFRVSDKVRAAADITWEHGAASEDDRGNVALEYGFVEYTVSDLFKVRVGKMFTPFGYFNEIHTAKPAFLSVKEASSTNKPERIVDGAYRFFPRWGVGIALAGDGTIGSGSYSYNLFVANGDQENTNPFEEDDNQAKAITGRFRIEPTPALRLGASFYHDSFEDPLRDNLTSYGVELMYTHRRLRLLLEAVVGSLKMTDGQSEDQVGWFIQPSYHLDSGLTPYARYEVIDPDTDRGQDGGTNLVVGLNYELSGSLMLKIENNYFHGDEASSLGLLPGDGYSELKAAVVLGF